MKNHYQLKKLILSAIGIFSLIIILASCSAAGKFKHYYDPNSIPADLKKDGYVLLVLKQDVGGFRGVQNRGVNKLMRRHYGAPFEMVSTEDLKNTKYDDTNKYRYIIGRDFNSGLVVTTTRSMAMPEVLLPLTENTTQKPYLTERKIKAFLLSAIPVPVTL
jgi:hypothetical protein